jgi:hypothetical protein
VPSGVLCTRPSSFSHTHGAPRHRRELRAVCDALGAWGAKWLELAPEHLVAAGVLRRGAELTFDPRFAGEPLHGGDVRAARGGRIRTGQAPTGAGG